MYKPINIKTMKKLNFKSLIFLISLTFCIGSFFSCSNPVKEELTKYVSTYLSEISDQETKTTDIYESVTGDNAENDLTSYYVLKDSLIPAYREYIKDLESITSNLKTIEVRELHEKLIESANTQFSGFTMILSAIEQQDMSIVTQANEKLDKARKLARDWETDFIKLCNYNNVKIDEELMN